MTGIIGQVTGALVYVKGEAIIVHTMKAYVGMEE